MYGNQLPEVTISPVAIEIGTKAWQALLEEVYTTPKPGLVDTWSCGAHTDMDVHTFERSAEALRPYFIRMAEQGYTLQCSPKELFVEIRKTGILAEQEMYRATDGVNTHKGLIFTLGIFCAAAGRCAAAGGDATAHGNTFTITALFYMEQQMTAEILTEELRNINSTTAVSNGEKNLLPIRNFRNPRRSAPGISGGEKSGSSYSYGRNQSKKGLESDQASDTDGVDESGRRLQYSFQTRPENLENSTK